MMSELVQDIRTEFRESPGIVAMVRLTFVPILIAIEADRESQPLARSRLLAAGRFWRMFAVGSPAYETNRKLMYVERKSTGML